MHDALADRSRIVYDPYTPEQQQGIRRQIEKFVAAEVTHSSPSKFLELVANVWGALSAATTTASY